MNRTEVARYLAALTDDEYDQLTTDARKVTQYLTSVPNDDQKEKPAEPIRNSGNDPHYPPSWGYHPEGGH